MGKKMMMLLAFAVAAMFALPSAASAQEAHISGISNFTGHGGSGVFTANGEPTIKATTGVITGSFDSGSTTTGIATLDFTGSTAEFLGIKTNCNTEGAASGTIRTVGTFHVITINNKPGILLTPGLITVICAGFSRIEFSGNIIGTITNPPCGSSSKNFTVAFEAEGFTQKHITYTGVSYDLKAQTENSIGVTSGSPVTAGLTSTLTLSSATSGTLECT
jgi:hypothetical protein